MRFHGDGRRTDGWEEGHVLLRYGQAVCSERERKEGLERQRDAGNEHNLEDVRQF